jgi:hypothetical protein
MRTSGRRRGTLGPAWAITAALLAASACSVYDTSLLEGGATTTHVAPGTSGGGQGGAGGTNAGGTSAGGTSAGGSSASGAGGHGGANPTSGRGGAAGQGGTGTAGHGGSGNAGQGGATGGCSTPSDCPGQDTACSKRTCVQSTCGVSNAVAGTFAEKIPGTCHKLVCDGKGGAESVVDDTNLPADDGKQCTVEGCLQGAPVHNPKAVGTACNQNGGKVCDAAADCVECLGNVDCATGVCDVPTGSCVAAPCKDGIQDGTETDVDCGGGACPACALGKKCKAGGDCVSATCTGGLCSASCSDGVKDGDETDVDCGGSCPQKCDFGQGCAQPADCASAVCTGGACACAAGCACDHLLISEVRSRGIAGGSDEFVELYNPKASAVVLDGQWTVDARSASAGSYTVRFAGNGASIPSHGHFLVAGNTYSQKPLGDATLLSGIGDASSVRLLQGGVVVDSVCFAYSQATASILTTPGNGYTCNGSPADNSPHNDTSTLASNVDQSVERKPGGAAGNCTSTGDDSADFLKTSPAAPQSLASAPTP